MINFSKRSYQKELLDRDEIPFADIALNMKELDFINTHLGGHAITIAGFKILLPSKKEISICEIGCGGGDNLYAINQWCKRKNVAVNFTGIDKNPACIAYAKDTLPIKDIEFIVSDYALIDFKENKPAIIFSSLFCHHFSEDELLTMLQWMKQQSTTGFFINDLHRHPVAYFFIQLLTKFFSKSYLVKNDAPLSVLRGFTKNEWISILKKAGIKNYSIKWKWAFRYLIVVSHE